MTRLFYLPNLVEANGKTIRENNLALQHQIPVGSLVEIVPSDDDSEHAGVRLYVVLHRRDCDGEPLYSLAVSRSETDPYRMNHGWPEYTLKVIAVATLAAADGE